MSVILYKIVVHVVSQIVRDNICTVRGFILAGKQQVPTSWRFFVLVLYFCLQMVAGILEPLVLPVLLEEMHAGV